MKKLLFVLALWFLADWAFHEKLKPFIKSEFGVGSKDSATVVAPNKDTVNAPDAAAGNIPLNWLDTAALRNDTIAGSGGINIPLPNNNNINTNPNKPRIPLPPVSLEQLMDTFKKRMPNFELRKFVYGLDISKYQGDIVDMLNRRRDSLAFLICKATEGTTITDSHFADNWPLIRQKYFIRGAYHFYHCTSDPIKQVDYFLSVTGAFSKSDLPPVIDVEESSFSSSCNKTQAQKDILTFLTELEKRTGRRPIIYTNNNTGNVYLTDPAFSKYPLWVAYYGTKSPVPTPDIWDNLGWNMWQKSESYKIQGFTSDYDVFNGGLLVLRKFIMTH